jgi:hypothetical protein
LDVSRFAPSPDRTTAKPNHLVLLANLHLPVPLERYPYCSPPCLSANLLDRPPRPSYFTLPQDDRHLNSRQDARIFFDPCASEEKAKQYKGSALFPPLRCPKTRSKRFRLRRAQSAFRVRPQCRTGREGHKCDDGKARKTGTMYAYL